MAKNTSVDVGNEWTQLTSDDASTVTFQNLSDFELFVQPTVGATPPSSSSLGLSYLSKQGERAVSLSELAPGIAATRLYARFSGVASGRVWVSHD